jgi:hypothetical protein
MLWPTLEHDLRAQFAQAQIYIAANAGTPQVQNWTQSPSLSVLEAPVQRLYKTYIEPYNTDELWDWRAVTHILVRMPNGGGFNNDTYMVYDPKLAGAGCEDMNATTCKSKRAKGSCRSQVVGMGPLPLSGTGADGRHYDWTYLEAERRVNQEFISINTGDIILLANVRNGYQFGEPYLSQHGTLTGVDGRVPVAFGYPAAVTEAAPDDILAPLRSYLGTANTPEPKETPAILRFFGISPSEASLSATFAMLASNFLIGLGALGAAIVLVWTSRREGFEGGARKVSWGLWAAPWILTLLFGPGYFRRQLLLAFSGVFFLMIPVWWSFIVALGLLFAPRGGRSIGHGPTSFLK